MNNAALAVPQSLPVTGKRLRTLLEEQGLRLEVIDRSRVVGRWPIGPADLNQRCAVFTMNEQRDWRGVLLVGNGPAGFDLVAQKSKFVDLLEVSLWLAMHDPQPQPPRKLRLSR